MKLVAEILTGSLFYVEVGEDATVGDLKKQIGSQENLPTERLILMLDLGGDDCDRPLLDKDEAPLRDYGIRDSSKIYIFFKHLDDEVMNDSIDPSILDFVNSDFDNKVPSNIEPSNEASSNEASNEADDQPTPSVGSSSDQPEE